jgi:quinol-cytochrome oxidoreductase complex cytochrome b subunit
MIYELKILGLKFIVLVAISPMLGFFFLKFIDQVEEAWKTNNRRKKWIVCSIFFMLFAVLSGWLL